MKKHFVREISGYNRIVPPDRFIFSRYDAIRDTYIFWLNILIPFVKIGYFIRRSWYHLAGRVFYAGYLEYTQGEMLHWWWPFRMRYKKKRGQ